MRIILILFLLTSLTTFGQTKEEISDLLEHQGKSDKKDWTIAQNNKNEFELVFSGLFLFYKHFISSQDASRCNFTPSCSVYAIQAVKKEGPVIGMINFMDRFSRCNGLSPEHYEADLKQNLLIDPVKDHKFH